jgi:hypothetical protein
MDELGAEAVEAVREAAQRAAEWPSRERMEALARSLDLMAARDAQLRAYRSLVLRVAALSAGPGMPNLAAIIADARTLAGQHGGEEWPPDPATALSR